MGTWQFNQISTFPEGNITGFNPMLVGDNVYVTAYGNDDNITDDKSTNLWKFNITSNIWEQLESVSGGTSAYTRSFYDPINNKICIFLCTNPPIVSDVTSNPLTA